MTYQQEVYAWLSESDFDCIIQKDSGKLFASIAVIRSKKKILEIKLIETELWLMPFASDEYEAYLVDQQQLRHSGIVSVVLWEDLWKFKKKIVQSRISALLGKSTRIPGRLTYISRLHKKTSETFLERNHLQGSVSSKYRYGLYLPARYFRVLPDGFVSNGENQDLLVAVATFSNARIFAKNEKTFRSHELIRFSNLRNTTVVGGMDKLLSAFIKEFHPDDIMSYVDLEWSDGAGYTKLGFNKISAKPSMQLLLDPQTNERFSGKNIPENRQVIKITNAGNLKFVKTISKSNIEI
ncbi:hypothetical protein [Dyadobacter psychrotolerans]|uniref:Uncharacterized protein n=1 Tax=Dyadobacter psychrotolerans TaxID=2541721 RepID=A0A4R5DTF1_9BACT|nr:hypothetical protein [Dyadobacter psychrotolerans]TDE15684.1 hypothetical protein E0F88_14405 [Dyadobacter psychrotolerans]